MCGLPELLEYTLVAIIIIFFSRDLDSNDIAFIEDGTFAENRPSRINYM